MEKNKIYNMDCLAGMSMIPDGAIDLILTDLPYGVTSCIYHRLLPLDQLWKQFMRVIKLNGAIVLSAYQPFTTRLIESNRKWFRYCWYWRKNNPTGFCFAKYQPMRCIEDVVVFYRRAPYYDPQGLIPLKKPRCSSRAEKKDCIYKSSTLMKPHEQQCTGYPKNLLEFAGEHGLHPTQKPVALMEYLVRTYTRPGELVLDCCMGSGTTAIACINSGRDYIGFEIDSGYFTQAQRRIEMHRKEEAHHGETQNNSM